MKIAIDIRSVEGRKAGKGWYTFHLVKNLLKTDKRNYYILYGQNPEKTDWNFDNARLKSFSSGGIFWHLKVAMDLLRENPDIFFAPTSYIIPSFLPKRIKTIVTIHDLISVLFPSTHLKKAVFIEKFLLNRVVTKSSKICAVSENTKKDILEKFHCPSEKIDIVYCGVSENFRKLSPEDLFKLKNSNIAPKKFFIAVSTIEPRKNYLNLISAFAIFSKRYPEYELIIVGQKGWQFENVFSEVKNLKLGDKVKFPDYLPENGILNLFNLAEALVFPSFYEGFGIPPLEAMKCGCPVIASKASSIPEVVGDAGLLIDPENPSDIAEKMFQIVENKKLKDELIQKGFKRAQLFNWEKSANKLLNIFNSLE